MTSSHDKGTQWQQMLSQCTDGSFVFMHSVERFFILAYGIKTCSSLYAACMMIQFCPPILIAFLLHATQRSQVSTRLTCKGQKYIIETTIPS